MVAVPEGTEMPDMKLHVLSTGVMECDQTWLLLKAGTTIKSQDQRFDPIPWTECPTHAVLIEHPDGNILWDTGVPRDWETRWAPSGLDKFFPVQEEPSGPGYLDSALNELGFESTDIDMLVLSHLHLDHAANARDFANGKTRILANDKEIAGANAIDGDFQGAFLVSDYKGLEMDAISGDIEILPGVSVIETPGHTWGTMSLKVDLPNDGTYIFTSDAVYLGDSWGPPSTGAAIVWDNLKWLESVDKLRRIAAESNATVVFGHDPEQRKQLKLSPNGFYS